MPKYEVWWTLDIECDEPEQAVVKAVEYILSLRPHVNCDNFEVITPEGNSLHIAVSEVPEAREIAVRVKGAK